MPEPARQPESFDRFYLHRRPITVIDMLAMEYYQEHTEGLGEAGVVVRLDKIQSEGLKDVSGLVDLLLSFGKDYQVEEKALIEVLPFKLMAYQDIAAEHGIGSAEALNVRKLYVLDRAFLACADASDFVRREYLKRKKRE